MSYEEQKAQEQIEAGIYHEEQRLNKEVEDRQANDIDSCGACLKYGTAGCAQWCRYYPPAT